MAQSSVLPSMRGILSGGNWKILKVTSGRSSPNCAGRNSKPRKAQRNHRLDINLLHFNRTVSPASHAPTVATAAVTRAASVNAAATLPRNENMRTKSGPHGTWGHCEVSLTGEGRANTFGGIPRFRYLERKRAHQTRQSIDESEDYCKEQGGRAHGGGWVPRHPFGSAKRVGGPRASIPRDTEAPQPCWPPAGW